jgi:hypothetical protein
MRWLLAALVLALSAPAFADGSGSLSGTGKLKVKGCGGDSSPMTWNLDVTGGAFTIDGGPAGGTAMPVGASGKIWNLAFDANTKAGFDMFLAAIASNLCETQVTLTQPSTVSQFNLKLNKRQTRAKLTLFVSGSGVSIEGASTGTLKLKLRGSWQAAQP